MFNQSNSNFSITVVPKEWLEEMKEGLEEMKSLIIKQKETEFGEQWIESPKARQMLGVSAKTWQTYRDNRIIPFSQFGRKIYFKRQDLEEFMQSNYIPAK